MKNSKFIILCIVSVLCMGSTKLVAQSVSYWDGSDTTVWTQGAGTLGSPYLIESAANLACLAKRVNEGTKYEGVYFKLTTNLNLAAGNWTPIGISSSNYFGGYFDGDYYTIDSLTISVAATANSFVGLFGIVQNSIIQKVILSNVNVSQTSVSSNIYTGGLLGATLNGDYISNCSVLSGSIYSVSSSGNKAYAGGIVSASQFKNRNIKITNCSNNARVYANYAVGGIVGMFNATSEDGDTIWLSSCHNTGPINGLSTSGNVYCGGVIGFLNLSKNKMICYIDNCYNTAYVKDSTHGGLYIYTGGLIGYLQNLATGTTGIAAYISNSWNTGRIENINTSLDFTTTNWSYVAGITGNTTLYGVANINYFNVYNTGNISFLRRSPKTTSAVAGILGLASTQLAGGVISLQQAYNTGNINLLSPDTSNKVTYAGGIIGWLYNSQGNYIINKCLNTGTVTNESYYSGGIVGYVNGFSTSGNILSNCFNSGTIQSKNTAGGIMAYYLHKSSVNTVSNCFNVGVVNALQGNVSGIAGVLGDSTILNLSSCYYDRQITNVTQGALATGLNSSCIYDTLRYARQLTQLQLDASTWYMESKMYPRLHFFKDMDAMILGATPIFFYANASLNSYNTLNKVNKSFGIGGKMGVYVHSSNTGIISIINNDSAIVTPLGIDTVTMTLSYGSASRQLRVIVRKEILIETEVCQGEVYSLLGRNINTDTAGIFTYYGSDTVIQVTVHPTYLTQENYTICSNENYVWHGQTVNQAGSYYDTLTSIFTCDSVCVLNLIVNPISNEVDTITFCNNQLPLLYKKVFIYKAGDYTTTHVAANGCDSIIGIHVIVNPSYDTIVVAIVTAADFPYTFGSQTLTKAGTYKEVFSSIANCDSIVHLALVVGNLSGDTVYSNDSKKICKSELPYSYGSRVFPQETESGVYEVGFKTIAGKDSIVFLYLSINDAPAQPDTILGPQTVNALGKYAYSINPVVGANEYRWGVSNSLFVFEDEANISNNTVLYIAIAGNAIITVAAGNECGFSADQSLEVVSSVSISEISSDNLSVKLYPNPSQDYVDVLMKGDRLMNSIQLVDVYGKLIKTQIVNDVNTRIDLSDVSNGIYFILVKDGNQLLGTYKMIRNK